MAASLFVWVAALFSSFGAFLFGYSVGSINGVQDMKGFRAVLSLDGTVGEDTDAEGGLVHNSTTNFTILEGLPQCVAVEDMGDSNSFSQLILGLLVSIVNIGGLLGSLIGGKLADFAGRKLTIMMGGSLSAVGGALFCTAVNVWMVIVGRFMTGIGFGLLYVVIPVYIAEISPERSRGKLSSTMGPMYTGGLLVGFAVNVGCVKFELGWRVSLGLQAVFGIILAFGMFFQPRTPRWLLKMHKDNEAREVLARVYPSSVSVPDSDLKITDAFIELKKSIQGTEQDKNKYTLKRQFRGLLSWPITQRVLIGVTIASLSPICGNFMSYYSVSLFCKLRILPYITTLLTGVLVFGASLVTVFLVDKVGRRVLLLVGSLCMFFTLLASVILIVLFQVEEDENVAVGYTIVVLLCTYVFSFSTTWLTIPWIVNGEIFPMCVRGLAVSLTSGALWLAAFFPVQLFPILLASPLKISGTFSIIAGLVAFSFVFTFLLLPETKGVSLEEMDELFAVPWSRRIRMSPCRRYPKDQAEMKSEVKDEKSTRL